MYGSVFNVLLIRYFFIEIRYYVINFKFWERMII